MLDATKPTYDLVAVRELAKPGHSLGIFLTLLHPAAP
jgi:hypothetical protein